ncbi:hypothetical protein [Kordiimonas sp.]|uniref:hypothetical protein n=1 Tax=Kordiimonas sp. TaxID=1970157 RepID=UPI003A8FB0F0
MLDIHADVRAALAADHVAHAWLLDLGEGAQQLHWTSHAADLVVGATSYKSEGHIAGLPAIVRERAIKLQSYTIRLIGSDRLIANTFRQFNMTGLPVVVSLALLDVGGEVIGGDAIRLYKGSVQSWRESEDDGSATLELKITSPWSKPSQTAGRLTSTSAQQDRYAGDRFFEFAHVEKTNLGWGGKA